MELADRRVWFTADRSRLVDEGDPEAAFLAAVPGRPLPAVKAAPVPENKMAAPEADKAESVDVHVCDDCGFTARSAAGLVAHARTHDVADD